eukprot:1176224-Prorocentrum_minimum.AAC.3
MYYSAREAVTRALAGGTEVNRPPRHPGLAGGMQAPCMSHIRDRGSGLRPWVVGPNSDAQWVLSITAYYTDRAARGPQEKAKRDAELAQHQMSEQVSRFMVKEGIAVPPRSLAALAEEWDLDNANLDGLWESSDASVSQSFDNLELSR